MTVYVRMDVAEIAVGNNRVRRDRKKRDRSRDTDRVWAFDGPPDFEDTVLKTVAHTANHPGGVPLSHDEELQVADEEAKGRREQALAAKALADVARERLAGIA